MSRPLSFSPAEPIREAAFPLSGGAESFTPLLEWLGDASLVVIGEATCGTYEFQHARVQITRRLIEEHGFTTVALDADWYDTRRANRFVRGQGRAAEAVSALAAFQRFPAWRWRNAVTLDFLGWLRSHNETLPPAERVGFYGLDLFNTAGAASMVLDLLDRMDPSAAQRLREAAVRSTPEGLRLSPVVAETLLGELLRRQHRITEEIARQGGENEDDFFFLLGSARFSRSLAGYYRRLFLTANREIRNRHLADVVDAFVLASSRPLRSPQRMVIWTDNALAGDSRAVEESAIAQPASLGQLIRERHAAEAFLIGQTTASGSVTTAPGWDRPVERRFLPPVLPGSVEALFHQSGISRLMLNLQADDDATELLREPHSERMLGPVLPGGEQQWRTRLADRFDAVLHFDDSRAVEPLEVA